MLRLSFELIPLAPTAPRDPSYSDFWALFGPETSTADRLDVVGASAVRLASSITLSDCGDDLSVGGPGLDLNQTMGVEIMTADGAACPLSERVLGIRIEKCSQCVPGFLAGETLTSAGGGGVIESIFLGTGLGYRVSAAIGKTQGSLSTSTSKEDTKESKGSVRE